MQCPGPLVTFILPMYTQVSPLSHASKKNLMKWGKIIHILQRRKKPWP